MGLIAFFPEFSQGFTLGYRIPPLRGDDIVMSLNPQQLEQLLSCRIGDLEHPALLERAALVELSADPALQASWERQQQWDARLGAALTAIAPPVALQERILGRLAQHAALSAAAPVALASSVASENAAAPEAAVTPTKQPLTQPHSRRYWLRMTLAGTIAAAATAGGILFWPQTQPLSKSDLEGAIAWLDKTDDAAAWRTADFPTAAYPLPRVLRYQPLRWQNISRQLGHTGVAYDFTVAGGPRARLFVLGCAEQLAGGRLPAQPQFSTHGVNVTFWQNGEQLYVFVVEGPTGRYHDYLNPHRELPVV